MIEALPWIMAASAGVDLFGKLNPPKPPAKPQTLGWDEALGRAGSVVDPLYDQKSAKVLENLDTSLVNRGFYGQRPGDTLAMKTQADMEKERAAQTAALASDLVGRSESNALNEWAMMMGWNQGAQGQGAGQWNQWIDLFTDPGRVYDFPSLGELFKGFGAQKNTSLGDVPATPSVASGGLAPGVSAVDHPYAQNMYKKNPKMISPY